MSAIKSNDNLIEKSITSASINSEHEMEKIKKGENGNHPASALNKKQTIKEWIKNHLWPFQVYFILGNEFCERFCYYGMKAVLPLFLTGVCNFTEKSAITFIHGFNFSAYFYAFIGAIISDQWLGRYMTILVFSMIYACGSTVLSIGSMPFKVFNSRLIIPMVGLFLLTIGTGGIKPCVSVFGGDQFRPDQTSQRESFYALFYLAVNLGSLISMLLTPELKHIGCMGEDTCYPLAFGVPAILMLIAIVVFVSASRLYRVIRTEESILIKTVKCLYLGVKGKLSSTKNSSTFKIAPGQHWLYYAKTKFSEAFIRDTIVIINIFKICTPQCLFWALYDQQSSRWVYQGVMMEGKCDLFGWNFSIKPEQMMAINAFLILIMVPLFQFGIYPLINKFRRNPLKPLEKMFMGMLLIMITFLMAAGLQFWMDSKGTFAPNPLDPNTIICVEGCVHILWQTPQYILVTAAEVLLSVTGLDFSYSEAPLSMKTVCSSIWLLTVAFGNIIVIIFTELNLTSLIFKSHIQAWTFLFWACMMIFGIVPCLYYNRNYVYLADREGEEESNGSIREEMEERHQDTLVKVDQHQEENENEIGKE